MCVCVCVCECDVVFHKSLEEEGCGDDAFMSLVRSFAHAWCVTADYDLEKKSG